MLQEIKRSGNGAVSHFPVISDDDLSLLANWNWKNPMELQLKAWFTLHFHTILRGRENLHDLKIEDLQITLENGREVARLRDKLTKNHRTDVAASHGGAIYGTNDAVCPVKLIKVYVSKLCSKNPYLWQRPLTKIVSEHEEWYANAKVGVNTVAHFMKSLSKVVGLSQIIVYEQQLSPS